MTAALLHLDGLACRRGHRLLWRALSLSLAAGEAVHVAGPNGCGKSSLLRVAAGLLPPLDGRVVRTGRAALCTDHCPLDQDLPLASALHFWRLVHGSLPDLEEVLAGVGLGGLHDVPVRFLSSGQRQRANLARLLLADAPLWLLDEPLNALDTGGVALVRQLVEQHRAGGGAVLFASHQPLDLAQLRQLDLAEHAP